MVYAAQAGLSFSTVTARNDVQAAIAGIHGSKQKWGATVNQAGTDMQGRPALSVEMRFTSKADSQDLMAKIKQQAVGARLPLSGSWVRIHDCPHDGPSAPPCVIEEEHVW